MILDISHETRYEYSAPVSLAHHLAHLRPLSDEQRMGLARIAEGYVERAARYRAGLVRVA